MRQLLLPLAWAFNTVTRLRNALFDRQCLLHSTQFPIPIIGIGNLAVGGTGKTPHTELVVSHLLARGLSIGILSRGYGRKTRGFRWVDRQAIASQVGDEPLQMRLRFDQDWLHCAVCEDRRRGIEQMLQAQPLDAIVLDDAFQHRYVKPGLNILLTTFDRLYTRDHLLPYGRLREHPRGAQRADLIIVTKCPPDLSAERAEVIRQELAEAGCPVYFSTIAYAALPPIERALLITGIAHPQPLLDHLHAQHIEFEHHAFADHHQFSAAECRHLIERAQHFDHILTTSKDATRLAELQLPESFWQKIITIPIAPQLLFDQEAELFNTLDQYVIENQANRRLDT
ncbi:MAG: tetraacyldisaccharide 4'-kinase [Bacteroidaceae bacterium]|nr:tetraacyldisaccharide 4'-kinase [Bacteroidaceae bacterium]